MVDEHNKQLSIVLDIVTPFKHSHIFFTCQNSFFTAVFSQNGDKNTITISRFLEIAISPDDASEMQLGERNG
jgi:hypothetical protein